MAEKHPLVDAPPRAYGERLWPDDEPSRRPDNHWLAPVPKIMTVIAQGSAPFISTFLMIHLSAPLAATHGGSSLASQVMILGREYYQSPFIETYLVKLPIGLHITSSILKRLTLSYIASSSRSRGRSTPYKALGPRPLSSTLAWTGIISASVLLPIHYWTHRVAPSLPHPPILAVGPAELDFEFVKTALQSWPIRSVILYAGLAGLVLVHATEGSVILARSFGGLPPSSTARRVSSTVVTGAVIAGLYSLWEEPMFAFSALSERYKAALGTSIWYRIQL